uniref:Sporulation protein RMD1 n=2 Tax=Lygus hesperus TaxID=30085 RepID=A0A0A9Z5F3_LYGHE
MLTMHTIITYYGSDVLNIRFRDHSTLEQKLCFIFDYGCIAFFNFTVEEENDMLQLLQPYEEETLPENEREAGTEDIIYVFGTRSQVTNDTVTLASNSTLEKLSIAFAMAQCVKLNIFEERVDKEIEKTRDLPESLAKIGSIGLTRVEMAKKIGKLFIERNNINLHADILDDPEFFWKQDKYKYVYEKLYKYLELNKRVALLNKRLVIMKELFDMISGQLESTHAEKLELIVIYLIVVEVVVAVGWQIFIKDILGFFQHCGR